MQAEQWGGLLILDVFDCKRMFRKKYYGVFRPSTFSHDSWKQKMSANETENIWDNCKEFMEKMEYERL